MDTPLLQKVEDYPEELPIYVHCRDWSEFVQYRNNHPTRTCVMIDDDVTLRGRTPGVIVHFGAFYAHPLHQAIEESIDRYAEEWRDHIEAIKTKQEIGDDDLEEYGV